MSMLHLRQLVPPSEITPTPSATATLTLSERRRSRLRITLDDGREAALLLPRGTALRDGDRLRADERGAIVYVRAASESLSVASTTDPHLLLRGAYHLGNRHVPVQLGPGWLAYEHDHVLDDMVRGLGLTVESKTAPFEPEQGAFSHSHEHGHAHELELEHGHGHGHGHGHALGHGHGHGHGEHG
jgi:urease accessory protein